MNKQGGSGKRGWSLNIERGGFASFQIAANSTTLVIVDGTALPTRQWVLLAGTSKDAYLALEKLAAESA